MEKQHNNMLSLFHKNSSTLNWIKERKQITTGLEHDRLAMDEVTLIADRLRIISKIQIELLIAESSRKTVAA